MTNSTMEKMSVCWIILASCALTWPAFSKAQESAPTQKSDQVFTSPEGGFQVKLEKPQISVRKIQPKPGTHVDLFLFRVTSTESQSAVSVSYHDLVKLPADKNQLDGIFDNGVSGFSKSLNGKVKRDQKTKVANLPARQIEFESTSYDRKIRGVSTWIVRKNRVYQLTYVASVDKYDERAAKTYMDSFRIIEIQQPKSPPVGPKKNMDPDKKNKKDKDKGKASAKAKSEPAAKASGPGKIKGSRKKKSKR